MGQNKNLNTTLYLQLTQFLLLRMHRGVFKRKPSTCRNLSENPGHDKANNGTRSNQVAVTLTEEDVDVTGFLRKAEGRLREFSWASRDRSDNDEETLKRRRLTLFKN